MTDDELDPVGAGRLRSALVARAGGVPPSAGSPQAVRDRVVARRRRRAGTALAVGTVAVLGGLVAFSGRGDDVEPAAVAAPVTAAAPTVTVPGPLASPPSTDHAEAVPLPTIGAYPRDPALGPQPTKVTYTVVEGDTIESIALTLGMDPETVRTQTGGTITVGQVLSLLVGPPAGPPVAPVTVTIP